MRPVRGECKTQIMQQETAATYTISESIKRDAEYECRSFPNKQDSRIPGSPSAAAKAYSIYSIRCSIYILRWAACDVQELLFRSTYGFAPLDENTQRSPSLAFDLLAKVHIKAMGVNSGDIMKY